MILELALSFRSCPLLFSKRQPTFLRFFLPTYLPSLVCAFTQQMFPECMKHPRFWIVLENDCQESGRVSPSILRVQYTSALRAGERPQQKGFQLKDRVYPGLTPLPQPSLLASLSKKTLRKDWGLTHQLNPLKSQLSPSRWTEHQPEFHIHDMVKRNFQLGNIKL